MCVPGADLSWTFSYASSSRQRPAYATYSVTYDEGCPAASQDFQNTCTSADHEAALQLATPDAIPTASVNFTCIGAAASGGCIVHSHADDSYSVARDRFDLSLGRQLDIIHLQQSGANASYTSPTWCLANKSHIAKSGNLILELGGVESNGASLDCKSRSVDLQPGDCSLLEMSHASKEKLEVCFNGH